MTAADKYRDEIWQIVTAVDELLEVQLKDCAREITVLRDALDQQRARAEAAEAELEKTVDWAGANVRIVRRVREMHCPIRLNNGRRGCPICHTDDACVTYMATLAGPNDGEVTS